MYKIVCSILLIFTGCSDKKIKQENSIGTIVPDSAQEELKTNPPSIIKAYDVIANDQADISLEFYTDSTFTLFFQQFPFPSERVNDPSDTILYKLMGRWTVKNNKFILNSNENHGFNLKSLFEDDIGVQIINKNDFIFDNQRDSISIWGLDCINRKL